MKAMIVSSDTARAKALMLDMQFEGFQAEIAPSAMYATSILERSQPDVMVADLDLPDLSGADLHEIVRGDPALKATAFILLANVKPEGLETNNNDIVLSPSSSHSEISLIAKRLVEEVMRQVNFEVSMSSIREPSIGGSLDDADLLNLLQWLAKSGSTGKLRIQLGEQNSFIFFVQGRPIHSEHQGRIGEEAVLRLCAHANDSSNGRFYFETLEPVSLELQTKTIRKSLFQLLLELSSFESHPTK
jgi:CheY-like chemotaxis protein